MSTSTAKLIILSAGLAIALPASAAHAQVNDKPDMADVARTPLEDLNIDAKDLPEILIQAVENPYDLQGMRSCNDLVSEIATLDNTLGPDFDLPREEGGRISAGRIAKSLVGSLIPFRSIVREITGANKRKDAFELAVTAGVVRRGFLKGVGQTRGCAYPARPRDPSTLPASQENGEGQE